MLSIKLNIISKRIFLIIIKKNHCKFKLLTNVLNTLSRINRLQLLFKTNRTQSIPRTHKIWSIKARYSHILLSIGRCAFPTGLDSYSWDLPLLWKLICCYTILLDPHSCMLWDRWLNSSETFPPHPRKSIRIM